MKSLEFKDQLRRLTLLTSKKVSSSRQSLQGVISNISTNEMALQQSSLWIRTVTWSLIGTTFLGFSWLALARTEEVILAVGKLEPEGDVKEIQIPSGGVIHSILVKNGQNVKAGQPLIQLDEEASREQLISIQKSFEEIKLQLTQNTGQINAKTAELKKTKELTNQKINSALSSLSLEEMILARLHALAEEGAVPDLQYLQQKNTVEEVKGEIREYEIDGDRQVFQITQQLEQLNSERSELNQKLAQLDAEAAESRMLNKYKLIKSPVSGVVFDLKPTSPGFTSQNIEPALKIVPFDKLEADVEIPSNKIGFIKPGQKADISIDSFPASDFGSLQGTVISVGSDALPPDPQNQKNQYRFPATIELNSQQLHLKNGKALELKTGMSLTANIKLRSVSYLQLLLSSFQSKTDSLRRL